MGDNVENRRVTRAALSREDSDEIVLLKEDTTTAAGSKQLPEPDFSDDDDESVVCVSSSGDENENLDESLKIDLRPAWQAGAGGKGKTSVIKTQDASTASV